MAKLTPEERFLAHINRNGPTPTHRPELGPCWVWTGKIQKRTGYGTIKIDRRDVRAHRFAWVYANGEIPCGQGFHGTCVLHHCDNRACVNYGDGSTPSHLFLGTHHENMTDCSIKGRRTHAKLTDDVVRALRQRYAAGGVSLGALAREYEVAVPTIHKAVRGLTWTHVV